MVVYKNRSQAKKVTGLSYLGGVATSSKIAKGLKYDEATYIIYLAPANRSGYEVCPMRSKSCTKLCLHESGHNKIDVKENTINNARITKTKLFFEQRDFFMAWLQDEISAARAKAQRAGQKFSVRLNGTSDLSPEQFHTGGKNILEIFPDVQFYDYTKVYKRIQLTKKYSNYDITFSYSGENMVSTVAALAEGYRAAMVFDQLPEEFLGYRVIDGDAYDMRYIDPSNVIVGLKYKNVRNKLSDSDRDFVISTK
jgi:hypothetical protein